MDEWISAETEQKEADFRGIIGMHMPICRSILGRSPNSQPYLYADLFAGPGHLVFKGRRFVGSPLIVPEVAARVGIDYQALCFEKDPDTADRLRTAVAPFGGRVQVHSEPCEDGFGKWLERAGRQPYRYGLVYSDPIRDEIPHQLLSRAAELLPRVDLLSYVAATQYKRRRGVDQGRPLLSDHIAAVGKKYALIREPLGAWQWTFILWSNWVDLPEWRKRGFYRLDSEKGAQILERLDLSARELKAKANTALPLEFEEPPYRTYREYLKHPKFLAVRAQVFARARGLCERCYDRTPTEPHHLRYPPWGTFDVPENMIAVCHGCHCEIHGKAS